MKTTIIKHTALAIFLLLTVGLVGCGDEENETKTPSEMLIGRWKLVKVGETKAEIPYYLTLKANGISIREYYDSDKKNMITETRNYTQSTEWVYDDELKRFNAFIQIDVTTYSCHLKNKEMVLDPVYPSFMPIQENYWREYYIKVKE